MTERDCKELAEVFALVLDSRLSALRKELAEMVVTTIDCVMEDLARIFQARNDQYIQELMARHGLDAKREQRHRDWLEKVLK